MKFPTIVFIALMVMPAMAFAANVPLVGQDPAWFTKDIKERLFAGEIVAVNGAINLGDKIQPGAWIQVPSWCTLNYVFKNKQTGQLAIGTAGHCTSKGQEVFMTIPFIWENNMVFLKLQKVGTTIFSINSGPNNGLGNDFALILIDPENYHMVDPSIRIIDGPCGYSTSSLSAGTQIMHFGHGAGIGTGGTFRIGTISATFSNPDAIVWHGAAIWGDSGSPVRLSNTQAIGVGINRSNAAAVGVQTHILTLAGVPTGVSKGTTMKKVMQLIPDWELVDSPNCS